VIQRQIGFAIVKCPELAMTTKLVQASNKQQHDKRKLLLVRFAPRYLRAIVDYERSLSQKVTSLIPPDRYRLASMMFRLTDYFTQFCFGIILIGFSCNGIFDGVLFFKFAGFGGSLPPNTKIFRLPYTGGDDLSQKCETSANSLKSSADEGDAAAQLSIGICLWYGKGIVRDPSAAAKYFKLSMEQGNSDAELNYGYCLRKGEGISQNLTQAADIFNRLAVQGHPGGQAEYRCCLIAGHGVPEDRTEGASYFKLSADQGNPLGQIRYGRALVNGIGVVLQKTSR
jgi:hypothetical protein